MEKVLFIAVHPDDETIGCGGTILKHKLLGNEIFWLIITNVDAEHGWNSNIVTERQKDITTVAEMYGFDQCIKLDFPTMYLDTVPYSVLITKISAVISEIKPSIIYLPNSNDIHTDHQITFKAAYSCTKNFRYPFIKKILMYETLSETEFAPPLIENVFIPNSYTDISDFLEKKIEIFEVYKSEVMGDYLPRSIETIKALSKVRGSRIGKKYAEAFATLLDID